MCSGLHSVPARCMPAAESVDGGVEWWRDNGIVNAFTSSHENAFTSSHENAFNHTHENAFTPSHENASTSNTTHSFSSDAVTTHFDPHIVGQAIHQDSFLLSVPLYAHTDAHFAAWPPARSPEQILQELFDRLDGWAEVTGVERGED